MEGGKEEGREGREEKDQGLASTLAELMGDWPCQAKSKSACHPDTDPPRVPFTETTEY